MSELVNQVYNTMQVYNFCLFQCALFFYKAPSEVTEFEVISLSPNDLYVSWNLPEYLNGILTKYKIVVYNEVYNQSITVFIPVPANHTNISEIIGK